MNTRIHVSGLVLLLVYHLAIAAVVTFFIVHCETATGRVFGERMSPPPAAPAPISLGRSE